MSAFDDAKDLTNHAKAVLLKIRAAYDASLHAQSVSAALRIEIKNLVENLRSALDFSAHGLFDRFGTSSRPNPKIYFPYAVASQDRATFTNSGRIEACIPGLSASRPDIVSALLEMQHFGTRGYVWLPGFMELTNENKHERLTPQIRKETKELRLSGGGASIGLGQGASISLGHGASISIGGAIIHGGQTFGVGNPPRMTGGKAESITWVSFHFDVTGTPVLPLLESALNGATQIVSDLAKMELRQMMPNSESSVSQQPTQDFG